MADTVGKRPTPTIATGKGNQWDKDQHGGTDNSRTSATKSPTGSRPVPTIATGSPPHATVPGPVKKPIKHVSMPTPNKDGSTGASRSEGGGSY